MDFNHNCVIKEDRKITDSIAGGFSAVPPLKQLVIDGQWDDYLPVIEFQMMGGWDRMDCPNFADLNALEILYFIQTGQQIDFSKRASAVLSGTSPLTGNYISAPLDSANNVGLILQKDWPDTKTPIGDTETLAMEQQEYYQPLPPYILSLLKKYGTIQRQWVNTDHESIIRALNYAPLPATVSCANGDGILNPASPTNHCIVIYGFVRGQYWKIFDSETMAQKKYAWDYKFGAIIQPSFILNDNYMPQFKDNTFLFVANGPDAGKFAMFLNGKMYVDDPAKLLAMYITRTQGKGITTDDFNKFPHVNLADQPVA